MKKTTISAFFALLIAFSAILCACSDSESSTPMGFMEISNDNVSYNLYVPEDWTADISTGITAAYYSGVDTSNISMMAFDLSGSEITSATDYWTFYEPSLKAMLPDLAYIGEPEAVTLDGVSAMQYIYTGTFSETQYKFMQIVAIKDYQVYIFTYTAAPDKYDGHIEDVLAILGYFDFT